ncbi:hypothetical protein DXG01_016141 [Tephrocybe rancida]|nr:hypothetical protein DXG01_016141 [Tephrocybe rancida]
MGKLTLLGYLREQLSVVPPVSKADLTGKTVVVVGANTGLGLEACKHFALMNAGRLILACRSKEKGEAALMKLQNETGYKGAELWLVDLSKFSSVVAFVDRFEQQGGRLDILVANAATITPEYSVTEDGWETSLQVNCLSLFLIALRLVPQMIKTGVDYATHPRLVIVTSEVHFWAKIAETMPERDIYKTLSDKEYCTPSVVADRYPDTKLPLVLRELIRMTVLDTLFYLALNERIGAQSPVIVNGVNPGFCFSELLRHITGWRSMIFNLVQKLIARTSEQGSRQLVYAAVGSADNEDQLRGAYISCARVSEASDFAIGAKGRVLQDKLWNEVVDILNAVDPRVREVVEKHLPTPPERAQ